MDDSRGAAVVTLGEGQKGSVLPVKSLQISITQCLLPLLCSSLPYGRTTVFRNARCFSMLPKPRDFLEPSHHFALRFSNSRSLLRSPSGAYISDFGHRDRKGLPYTHISEGK